MRRACAVATGDLTRGTLADRPPPAVEAESKSCAVAWESARFSRRGASDGSFIRALANAASAYVGVLPAGVPPRSSGFRLGPGVEDLEAAPEAVPA
jgi:hypothetical protein